MGKSNKCFEVAKAGDFLAFGGGGNIILREGRGHVMLFCSDGKKQVRIKLPRDQADHLLLALDLILYPQLHTSIHK